MKRNSPRPQIVLTKWNAIQAAIVLAILAAMAHTISGGSETAEAAHLYFAMAFLFSLPSSLVVFPAFLALATLMPTMSTLHVALAFVAPVVSTAISPFAEAWATHIWARYRARRD